MWCLPLSKFQPNLAFLQPCGSIILSDMFARAFRTHRRIQTLNYISIITSWVSAAAALMPLAPLIPGLLPPQTALGPPGRLHLMVIGWMWSVRSSRAAAGLLLGWAAPHAHPRLQLREAFIHLELYGRQLQPTAGCHAPNDLLMFPSD